jgi:hypothetical protein
MTASLFAAPLARPASASTGSTWTIIESAAALIGGIILYNNYMHKRQAANTVVGYTRNGGTVYGDGRIVMPNGAVIYPGPNGQYPWGQSAYYYPNAAGYTYDYYRTGVYDRTGRHCRRAAYRYRDSDDYAGRYATYASYRNYASYRSYRIPVRSYKAHGRRGHGHGRDRD